MGEQQKKKKQSNKGRQLMKRQRTFPDEDEGEEVPRSPTAATIGELPLSAPQSSQISQASEARQFIFMPTPKVHMQQSNNNEDPDFEIPGFEFEEDPAIRPRSVSEVKSRLQQRQKQPISSGTRIIKFVGDGAITSKQLEKQKTDKLKARKGNGKAQQ